MSSFSQMQCQRLLHQYVLAGFQSLPDQVIVMNRRRCDCYAFHFRVCQDFHKAGGRLHAIFLPSSLEHLWTQITNATQSSQAVKCTHNILAPVTTPDDSDVWTDHLAISPFPSW